MSLAQKFVGQYQTQTDAARQLGVAQSTLNAWVKWGKKPRKDFAKKMRAMMSGQAVKPKAEPKVAPKETSDFQEILSSNLSSELKIKVLRLLA